MKTFKNLGLMVSVILAISLYAACTGSTMKDGAVKSDKPAKKVVASSEIKGNLIKNGTFDLSEIKKFPNYDRVSMSLIEDLSNIGYWHVLVGANGNGEADIVNEGCKVKIFSPGNQTYGVQLSQLPLLIEKGKTYTVSFDASAEEPRTIVCRIGLVGPPWMAYSGDQIFNLTKEMKTYSFTFTMPTYTDDKARLDFNVGLSTKSVTIDNVVVLKAQ